MKRWVRRTASRLVREEEGQVLPLVAVMLVALLGLSGLAIDAGHARMNYRSLQVATDAAAMAGARALPNATTSAAVISAATSYSAVNGNSNAHSNLPNVTILSGYPALKCLTTLQKQGMACVGNVPYNAVQVRMQESVPMYFASLVGFKTMTIATSATAGIRGGAPTPYNVAILVDSTLSMNIYDSDCGATQETCALNGVQALLGAMNPCAASHTTCQVVAGVAQDSVDRVALFTFPTLSTTTVAIDTTCTTAVPTPTTSNGYWDTSSFGLPYGIATMPFSSSYPNPTVAWTGIPTAMPYAFPTAGAISYNPTSATGTYQVTSFLSDYRTSSSATTLNTNSVLVKAAGGRSGCGGILPPNYEAIYQTYYAGAIYAAQAALTAQKAANPGTQNVMIILSDGDANAPQNNTSYNGVPGASASYSVLPGSSSSGLYPSYVSECQQAITAAAAATGAGTRVYSVAYGAESSGCSTDTNGLNPCNTMAGMASAPQYFFSDYNQTAGNNPNCVAAQKVVSLNAIFTAIAGDLTTARLIPDNTP